MTFDEIIADPLFFDIAGSFALAMIVVLLLPQIMRLLPYLVGLALLMLAIYGLFIR
ncbi:hypothetical protein Ga0123462_1667 [Mariprofundus ferrinatatus]|uniref:Uncharacterized protein n=1 Tax=Mariprofundus ferrinatatus TaxID=1921087 RepID=A0A2K8L9G1_9PROT|nr:hypothetical protein [Mariprofundus ferrinatatus]ATX82521.1 hypothetical protein Ga0123462_1667 [Mariprofundus ferrinatatus]